MAKKTYKTVGALLDKLAQYPRNTRIVTDGYESDYDDVGLEENVRVLLNGNTHPDGATWCGIHTAVRHLDAGDKRRGRKVLALTRVGPRKRS